MFVVAIKNHQVFGRIIRWVHVYMVDNFFRSKESPEFFFHNNAMMIHIPTFRKRMFWFKDAKVTSCYLPSSFVVPMMTPWLLRKLSSLSLRWKSFTSFRDFLSMFFRKHSTLMPFRVFSICFSRMCFAFEKACLSFFKYHFSFSFKGLCGSLTIPLLLLISRGIF